MALFDNDEEIKKIRRKRIRRGIQHGIGFIDFLLVVFFVVVAVISITDRPALEQFMTIRIIKYGVMGLFLINFFLEFVPQIITPFATLLMSLITILNPHVVIIAVVLGSFCGSITGYFIGRKYGFPLLYDLFEKKKADKAVSFMKKYGNPAVLLAAISPFPYIPMVIGALGMSKKRFIFFGLIPRALGLIGIGYAFYFGVF